MYEKCLHCDHLGKDCIPNLYVMSIREVREWAKKLKDIKGWSNAYLAEMSGVPKGTIDSNFSKKSGKAQDVNYSTFAPVLCALIGCQEEKMPCQGVNNDKAQLREENEKLKKRIEYLESIKNEYDGRLSYLKEQMRWRKHVIVLLIGISCALITFILAGIAIDWSNNGIGFFWIGN